MVCFFSVKKQKQKVNEVSRFTVDETDDKSKNKMIGQIPSQWLQNHRIKSQVNGYKMIGQNHRSKLQNDRTKSHVKVTK
jgi:hypothetical protein